ncbi:ABC transporter B family member 25 [Hordeum vulgare]|nr:ABC transporter B family member 25 [Hordeum vulgare]
MRPTNIPLNAAKSLFAKIRNNQPTEVWPSYYHPSLSSRSRRRSRRGVLGPEDYVGEDVDVVAAAFAEQSLRDEAERRRHDKELEDLMFKQAVVANLATEDKDDEWRHNREE